MLTYEEYKNSDKQTNMVLLLHGYGSNGCDMISIARFLNIENAIFIAPNAPNSLGFRGYEWFSLETRIENEMLSGAKISSKILIEFTQNQLTKHNITFANLYVCGFSQGVMISLYTFLRHTAPCKAIIGFSGTIISKSDTISSISSRPNVCIIHGDIDQVVNLNLGKIAHKTLLECNVQTQMYIIKNLDHSISKECFDASNQFLKSIN